MKRHRNYRHSYFISAVFLVLMSLTAARTTSAVDITLETFAGGFNNPVGIDFQDTSGKVISSANYFFGFPNNFQVTLPNGTFTSFSNVAGLQDELKIATVRASACQGGFFAGEVFSGNGIPGQILRISPLGLPVINPWATLPGEPANIRGSLFQDRFCVTGGDLIVATGNEQNGSNDDSLGNVWRVKSDGTPTLVAQLKEHLEGVVSIPNLPSFYGPLAGRILAGAENRIVSGQLNGPNGKIYAINPNGSDDWFTIGAGTGPTCSGPVPTQFCNYPTANPIHPEDLDIIRRDSEFFGVAFSLGQILKGAASAGDNAKTFSDRCGQVLITNEFPTKAPYNNTSGLSALRWNAGTNSFIVDRLTSNMDGNINQWEHVTFTSGKDCNTAITIDKTPDIAAFVPPNKLTFQIVVKNIGAFDASTVKVTDPLPTNGGLSWASATSTTKGSCSVAANLLTCELGDLTPNETVTINVTSNATTIDHCKLQDNEATVTADNAATAKDKGSYSCDPSQQNTTLTIDKTPNNGSFNAGDKLIFNIVVTNIGLVNATNVQVSDPLPTNGSLSWPNANSPSANLATTQGNCSIVANVLSCSLGTIAPNGTATIAVMSNTTPVAACQVQNNTATVKANNANQVSDNGSYSCQPPPTSLPGRITGGGSIFRLDGVRVTHGFELRCDANDKRQNLEINWAGGNNFHLTQITKVTCLDNPNFQPPPPPGTQADTYIGEGVGTCNKLPATIKFILTDAGEPGTQDTAVYHITGGCTLDVGPAFLEKGNHQFHKN